MKTKTILAIATVAAKSCVLPSHGETNLRGSSSTIPHLKDNNDHYVKKWTELRMQRDLTTEQLGSEEKKRILMSNETKTGGSKGGKGRDASSRLGGGSSGGRGRGPGGRSPGGRSPGERSPGRGRGSPGKEPGGDPAGTGAPAGTPGRRPGKGGGD